MKTKLTIILILTFVCFLKLEAQNLPKNCVKDTTGGYISIEDTLFHNPVCNYELLTNSHLITVHQLRIDRSKIPFYPSGVNGLYNKSGYSRGHVLPYEDLAWSQQTAAASMNLNRNLAPEPQNQNIGTELASEDTARTLAIQYGAVKIYAGTTQPFKVNMKGIAIPKAYWKVIVCPHITYCYWMPTTGSNIGYHSLGKCHILYSELVNVLGFDPIKLIGK